MGKTYTIKMASKLSGLSELVIRSWESRYNAVSPERSESNRRLYSENDIGKLMTLKKLTEYGHRIGSIASLSDPELKELLLKSSMRLKKDEEPEKDQESEIFNNILNQCIESIRNYDSHGFEQLLSDSFRQHNYIKLIDKLILPLMKKIGDFWSQGILRISHEHFTSSIVKKFLNNLVNGYNIPESAPHLVVTTPQGQYHEVGALIGSVLASSDGWKITYLGPSLPAEEIAGVVDQINPKAVFLSLVYPFDDTSLIQQLKTLRAYIGNIKPIIVNGNAVENYLEVLAEINALAVADSMQFRNVLNDIRNLSRVS